jgi:hypothetical protein
LRGESVTRRLTAPLFFASRKAAVATAERATIPFESQTVCEAKIKNRLRKTFQKEIQSDQTADRSALAAEPFID